MELRELKYFLAVAREESITKAAESVCTTQPNLSRQMRKLENEIGKPLLIRGSRKIALTEAGKLLRKRAEEIVGLYDKTEAELVAQDENVKGDIYIGGGESYVLQYVARAIKMTQSSYPEIRFHIFSGDAGIVTERLDNGLIDFGVLIDYNEISKYDFIRLPLADTWGVLMKKDSPLAEKPAVTADNLKSLPLIFSQQVFANKRHVAANWFLQLNVTPNIVATYNLVYNASILVEEGVGYAVGLDKIIRTDGDSNLCFRPLAPRIESHLDIAWKKYATFPRFIEIFIEQLKSIL